MEGAIVDGHNEGRGEEGPVRVPPLQRREGRFLTNAQVVSQLDCREHWGKGEILYLRLVSDGLRLQPQ